MKRSHLIVIIVVLIISVASGYWITQTERYKNYRQMQLLDTVVYNTLHPNGYTIKLTSNYDILGYQMNLEGEGIYSTTLYMNYLMKLNGTGVSPMTVELNQYIDNNIQYMNINQGQWFKEPFQDQLTILDQLSKKFKQSKFHASGDYVEIIDDNERIQKITFTLPFLESDYLTQQLIKNITNISNEINFEKIEPVTYTVTINKQEKQIITIEIDYTTGIQQLINVYFPTAATNLHFNTTIELINIDQHLELPEEVKTKAVNISDLK